MNPTERYVDCRICGRSERAWFMYDHLTQRHPGVTLDQMMDALRDCQRAFGAEHG